MRRAIGPLVLLLVSAGALVASLPRQEDFPHERHEGLFPLCVGCHVGAATGIEAELFPEPASCAACHDGERQDRVVWSPPAPRASNLTFSHPDHAELVEIYRLQTTCGTCHSPADPPGRMSVTEAAAEGCLGCHVHEADQHLAEGRDCIACHLPLTDADRLPLERIAQFPAPASHDAPDFVLAHAPATAFDQASCATCHAQETCLRCHVNAGEVEAIVALERDSRVARLEAGREAVYPLPATHMDPVWSWAHGTAAAVASATCANCHASPSCTTCHLGEGGSAGAVIAGLPIPEPGGAPGVDLSGAGAGVHPRDFAEQHAAFAASGALNCLSCHTQERCVACHVGGFAGGVAPGERDERGSVFTHVSSQPAFGVAATPTRTGRGPTATVSVTVDTVPGPRAAPAGPAPTGGIGGYHSLNFMERHATEVFMARSDCQSCHSTEAFCRDCHTELGLASSGRLNTAFHTAQPLWLLSHGEAARLNLESCAACHAQTDCVACHSAIQGRGINPHGPAFNADRMRSRNGITCQWCHLGG